MELDPAKKFELARELILMHGWNSTCYQILNPGIELWISDEQNAVIGFVRSGKFAVVAGAPVCRLEALHIAIQEWTGYCQSQSLIPTYFGAETRLQTYFSSLSDDRIAYLGSQPEWSPIEFAHQVSSVPSLKAQLARAKNHGVTVRQLNPAEALNNAEIQSLIHDWLSKKGLPPLHFLVEPNTLEEVRDRKFFVAERHKQIVGCLNLCPIPARNGWLTEQFMRAPGAPNGVIELLLSVGIQTLVGEGANYITMGIVPLGETRFARKQRVLNFGSRWVRAHLNRFYNFQGLFHFKNKFRPTRWEPVVLISPFQSIGVKQVFAVVRAFTQIHPVKAILIGLSRAVRQETRRLVAWRKAA